MWINTLKSGCGHAQAAPSLISGLLVCHNCGAQWVDDTTLTDNQLAQTLVKTALNNKIAAALEVKQSQPMHLLTSSQNESWRTPAKYIEAARLVMGSIDLDPASSELANETIKATQFFTKEQNGLALPWHGNVWLNPPYGKTNNQSNQGLFTNKLVSDYRDGSVQQAVLLVNFYTGYAWFAPLRELPMCMPDHRVSFIDSVTNVAGGAAKASSVFVYFGNSVREFYRIFKQFGPCGQFSLGS